MRLRALALALALLLSAGAAHGLGIADRVAQQLRAEGYVEVTISRTLLGRTRIYAIGPNGTREIIIDPRNGEILRDLWIGADNVAVLGHFVLEEGSDTAEQASGDGDGSGDDGGGDDGGGDEEEDDGEDEPEPEEYEEGE